MKSFFQSSAIASCGLLTSILTAAFNVLIHYYTGFDLFTLSIWVIIPIGAIISGAAAASGYYFGSLYFHERPNNALLLQMVCIAVFTHCLIYYLNYRIIILDNGEPLSNFIAFSEYLQVSLTKSHYRFGRSLDIGEVGKFGYGLAFIEFIGFLLGGLSVYAILLNRPTCAPCNKYLRSLARKNKNFVNLENFTGYYEGLIKHEVDSSAFATMITQEYQAPTREDAIKLVETLYGCPDCKVQMIDYKTMVRKGSDWKNLEELDRRINIASDLDMLPIFQSNENRKTHEQ
jgi:hypothetical protein